MMCPRCHQEHQQPTKQCRACLEKRNALHRAQAFTRLAAILGLTVKQAKEAGLWKERYS